MAKAQERTSQTTQTTRGRQKPVGYKPGDEVRGERSGFVPIELCDNFFENTGDRPVTKTVTICNDDDAFEMQVDIEGAEVTTIPAKKCKTIVVTIPKKKSLHVDHTGRYRPEPS